MRSSGTNRHQRRNCGACSGLRGFGLRFHNKSEHHFVRGNHENAAGGYGKGSLADLHRASTSGGRTWQVSCQVDPSLVALHKRSFLQGREYFVLRSDRAQLIVQADKVDLGPAVMYLLFDARDNHQSARKEQAFNFVEGQGMAASALEVILGGFPFTAFGHQTQTRWTTVEGIPAVEATWWAGGLRVTEQLLALADQGLFLRRINWPRQISAGRKMSLSAWPCRRDLVRRHVAGSCGKMPNAAWPWAWLPTCRAGHDRARRHRDRPVARRPGQTVSVDTLLLAQIPPAQAESWSPLTAAAAGSSVSPAGT